MIIDLTQTAFERTGMNYNLFHVDELPQGPECALARSERDVAVIAHIISRQDVRRWISEIAKGVKRANI